MDWIIPEWPAPPHVHALTTVRGAGFTDNDDDFKSFNLALHVGDDSKTVLLNRQRLREQALLPKEPLWLQQVHGITVLEVTESLLLEPLAPEADASVVFQPNLVSAVLTGDCLPILLCDKKGTRVSAIHAGWRGLSAGIIEEAVRKLDCKPEDLYAWLGPAIGPEVYEVKEDFLAAFEGFSDEGSFKAIKAINASPQSWLANLYQLATVRLHRLGVMNIYGGGFCTYSDPKRFYSSRRSKKTGRMATLIWFT